MFRNARSDYRKGKVNATNEFSTMQTIEADLKSLMRTFLGEIIEENCKNDKRITKHDCGYIKVYSMELISLEKRIMLDLAKNTE